MLLIPLPIQLESGNNCDVRFDGQEIVKTVRHKFMTLAEAEDESIKLQKYSDELFDQPLECAELLRVGIIPFEDGYRLEHAYEAIAGPSLTSIDPKRKSETLATLLAQVSYMDTTRNLDEIRVPFDAICNNFHVDENGPALVDLYPVLSRNNDGSFPREVIAYSRVPRYNTRPYRWGTKTGAITGLLLSSSAYGKTRFEKVCSALINADDWYYDVLPPNLDPNIKDEVRRQLKLKFAPLIGRMIVDKTLNPSKSIS